MTTGKTIALTRRTFVWQSAGDIQNSSMGLSDSKRDQLSPREEQIYLVPFHSAGVRKAGAPLQRLCLSLLGTPSSLALEPAVNPGPRQWHPVGSPKEGLGSSCIFGVNFVAGFLGGSDGKASACSAGDPGLIPGSGRSPGEGNRNLLQYSCLGNSMDGGAWGATVRGVAKSRTLGQATSLTCVAAEVESVPWYFPGSTVVYSLHFAFVLGLGSLLPRSAEEPVLTVHTHGVAGTASALTSASEIILIPIPRGEEIAQRVVQSQGAGVQISSPAACL